MAMSAPEVAAMTTGQQHGDRPREMTDAAAREAITAKRTFLGRAEARLSTMHRIAGSFLGGAGLLAVIPALMKDMVPAAVSLCLSQRRPAAIAMLVTLCVFMLVPFSALYFLIADIARFYFTRHPPANDPNDASRRPPRFSLFGLTLPEEGAPGLARKNDLLRELYETEEGKRARAFAKDLSPPEQECVGALHEVRAAEDDGVFHSTLSAAGVADLKLDQEIWWVESQLARASAMLRRLVLRYIKALVLLLLALLIGFITAGAERSQANHGEFVRRFVPVVYMVWAFVTPSLLRLPYHWMDGGNLLRVFLGIKIRDEALRRFENSIVAACTAVAISAGIWGALSSQEFAWRRWTLGYGFVIAGGVIAAFILFINRWPSTPDPAKR